MLLLIDNYDSFTYNLVQYFEMLGMSVCVYANDKISCDEIARLSPDYVVISPGPGRPEEAGITLDVIRTFASKIPMLGVCLGHQAIAMAFGAKIKLADRIMHGKTSAIFHDKKGIFHDLPTPLRATRYHSWLVDPATLPDTLTITAWARRADQSSDEIMGLQHRHYPVMGVQFHPESILTEHGHQLLANFLASVGFDM